MILAFLAPASSEHPKPSPIADESHRTESVLVIHVVATVDPLDHNVSTEPLEDRAEAAHAQAEEAAEAGELLYVKVLGLRPARQPGG